MRSSLLIAVLLSVAAPPAWSQEPGDPGTDIEDDLPPDLGDGGEEPAATPALPEDEAAEPEDAPATPPAVDPVEAMKKAPTTLGEELGKKAYEFCNDADFDAKDYLADRRFCRTWKPEELAACKNALTICKRDEPWIPNLNIPPVVGWILLSILVAAILYVFGRALLSAGWGRDRNLDLGEALDEAMSGEIQALPEAPALVILRRARETLEGGRAAEAAVLAQLAALRYFDDSGIVPFHPSRTNGEYLRALRGEPELRAVYKTIAEQTDRVRFGDGTVDPAQVGQAIEGGLALFGRAPERTGGFSPAALTILVVALGSGALSGCEGFGKPYYSHRPAGMAALPGLLRGLGLEVEISHADLETIPEKTSVVVVHGSGLGKLGKVKLDPLMDRDLAVLVIDDEPTAAVAKHFLPVTATVTSSTAHGVVVPQLGAMGENPGDAQALGPDGFCGLDLPAIDFELGPHVVRLPGARRLAWDGIAATASASAHRLDLFPILGLGPERAVAVTAHLFGAARMNDEEDYLPGCVFVLSSPDLLSNASLAMEGNARFVSAFFSSLTRKGEKVLLIDYVAGTRRNTGMANTVVDSKMLPLVIQGGLFVLMLFLFLGAAFGPLRDPVSVAHKSFSEHVDALGRHYAARGQAGMAHAARALARLVVLRHRRDLRATGGKEAAWQGLAAHLAEQYEIEEAQVGAALKLGLEGAEVTPAEVAGSESMLRTLSILLSGRRNTKKTKG